MSVSPHKITESLCPCYFAASNSGVGFVSYFDKVFDTSLFYRIYIIKGGPGTGKSSLMKEAVRYAQCLSLHCEGILCSSDPGSFDGVIINTSKGRIALYDGTSPHSADAAIPGAVDSIFDLGACWDPQMLEKSRHIIQDMISQKKKAYELSYAMLRSAHECSEYKRSILSECIDRSKLQKAIGRLLAAVERKGSSHRVCYKLKNAISADGYVSTDAYESEEGNHYAVYGSHDGAFAFFSELKTVLKQNDLPTTLSPSPLSPGIYDAVSVTDGGLFFYDNGKLPSDTADKNINTERFFFEKKLRETKPTLRMLSRQIDSAMSAAYRSLKSAKDLHTSIESIYVSAMDFEKKEKLQQELFDRLFN